ncbi:DUF2726 domain-containing protein [Falsiroseomonas sp. HW251]|uniref:DUF2726 domain-containing protein n=1 Tax=Falsiroseomonas sp. HW251 TaxID=3390998 RepID=UPI003D320C0F
MPPATSAAPDPAALLAILVVAGLFIGVIVKLLASRSRGLKERKLKRGSWEQRKRSPGFPDWSPPTAYRAPPARPSAPAAKPTDAADQLRIVLGAEFASQPLLNRSEARVFAELERAVIARNPNWRVMAQVSLGEVLVARDAAAFSCINSKRVDLLLVDGDCRPRHAIEYQGPGHYQGNAVARDAVKREALRRAGIGYHEVLAGVMTPAELRRVVQKLVDRADA